MVGFASMFGCGKEKAKELMEGGSMSAIFGFNFQDDELLKRMGETLKHRGPDGKGDYKTKKISFGHRDLVIDPSFKGKQPIPNEDGSIWMSCDGRIFNFRELRKELEQKGHEFSTNTDVEVIVHLYEERSLDFLKKLRGVFALVLYDSKKEKLILVRDRLGVKPLYYFWDGKNFIFASEIKGILEYEMKREIELSSLFHYLSFGYVPGRNTMIKGIKRILPAHYLIFDLNSKELIEKRYWDAIEVENSSSKNLEMLLKETLELYLSDNAPVGAQLSGGHDSSSIVAFMKKYREEVKTFCAYYDVAWDQNEQSYARIVAEALGTNHTENDMVFG